MNKKREKNILPAVEIEYDLDNPDDKAMYDEMLDMDGPVTVGGRKFDAHRILEEFDPTAYRCGFSDYVDYSDQRWTCPVCNDIFDDEDKATHHCQTEDDSE